MSVAYLVVVRNDLVVSEAGATPAEAPKARYFRLTFAFSNLFAWADCAGGSWVADVVAMVEYVVSVDRVGLSPMHRYKLAMDQILSITCCSFDDALENARPRLDGIRGVQKLLQRNRQRVVLRPVSPYT